MSTQTAAPFVATGEANELEWGKPRGDAFELVDEVAKPPVAMPELGDADAAAESAETAAAEATRIRHVSYAAPIAVPAHCDRHDAASSETHAAKLLAQAQPFMAMHANVSDTAKSVTPALPLRLPLILPARQPDARAASLPREERAAKPQAQPKPTPKMPHISYAAPIAVPSRAASSVAANWQAQPAAPSRKQSDDDPAAAGTEDPNWHRPVPI